MRYNDCMGTLYIVSTPIGNLEDITIRAIKTLFSVDLIACEDTRRTGLLLAELRKRYGRIYSSSDPDSAGGVEKGFSTSSNDITTLFSYYDETEQQRAPQLIEALKSGKNVALVSDAGTPLISDPGFKLVREAIKQGINVVSIPGPTAAIAALTVSGLATDKFFFLGYPPEKFSHSIKLFENLLNMNRFMLSTYILYSAPHKLIQTLTDMHQVFGDIDIVIARELTKIHEEIWRGNISKALEKFHNPIGEFILLFALKEEVQS